MKDTAVDWLIKQIIEGEEIDYTTYSVMLKEHVNRLSIFEKAKEMEKEQIKDAYYEGNCKGYDSHQLMDEDKNEYYYNNNYLI
jgi:uncharacterized protein (UPF0335 family)